MSNYRCEHCNTDIIDTPRGYITECEHYPLELATVARRSPILAMADCLSGKWPEAVAANEVRRIMSDESN